MSPYALRMPTEVHAGQLDDGRSQLSPSIRTLISGFEARCLVLVKEEVAYFCLVGLGVYTTTNIGTKHFTSQLNVNKDIRTAKTHLITISLRIGKWLRMPNEFTKQG